MIEPPAEIQSNLSPAAEGSGSIEWCLGLPLVENRPLSPMELTAFGMEAKRLRRRGRLSACAAPLILLIGLPGGAVLDPLLIHGQPGGIVLLALYLVTVFVAAALLFLTASDSLKRAKGLRADVNAAFCKCFAGQAEVYEGARPEGAQSGDIVEIEVLPGSRRLWKVNGRLQTDWKEVSWADVAEPPEFAAMAAAWVEPLRASAGDSTDTELLHSSQHGQRDLTEAEISELARRARQLWLRPLWPTLFFTLWLCIPLALHFFNSEPLRIRGSQYLLIAFVVFSWFSLIQGLLAAWRLVTDCEAGIVIIIRVPDDMLEAMKHGEATPQSSGSVPPPEDGPPADASTEAEVPRKTIVVELLPFSKIDWTEDGRPAAWRKVPGS